MYDENRPYWNGVNATHMRMMKTCGYCDKDIKGKPHIRWQMLTTRLLRDMHI